MQKIKDAASEFLAHRRVAVTGVSRHPNGHGGNVVYQRLRSRGYDVFAVNPNADDTMRECVALGIEHVWMHRGPGAGSVSEAAARHGRDSGIAVIDGGRPCMFGPTADPGHKAMRAVLTVTGHIPRRIR
jgi:hypothetical protein